jgi:hypothetical protein
MVLTTHTLLEPRLRKGRAIPLLPLYAFETCYRASFTSLAFHLITWPSAYEVKYRNL